MAAFFTCENGRYIPGRKSLSAGSATQLSGTVVCGLLAHGLETCSPGTEFVPARFTVDMFSPVLDEPIELRSAVVRMATVSGWPTRTSFSKTRSGPAQPLSS
ncbi:hypothetical protein [Rhodococcus sp. KBW08]|uniref:hypothetical protein n=1 Tax=Rhodococcus sp. KBW08 TaxID=2144188 RepID=UPI0021AA641A|nr:hypothetical protein [Rhodococcus sp. KBW08]